MARAARNGRMGLVGWSSARACWAVRARSAAAPGVARRSEVSIGGWVPSAEIATDAEPARAAAR